jgi:acyl-coenzyme A thioesterase PaaI-like protein
MGRDVRFCHGCSQSRVCRYGIDNLQFRDDTMQALAVCRDGEGGEGVAHGGWIASVFDEVVGLLPEMFGRPVVTAEMTISYLLPVPINRELVVRSWQISRDGRKWVLEGSMAIAGSETIFARARGLWIERRPDHFERHAQWLARNDQ